MPLLWHFKEREVTVDMSCPIAHFSGCYARYVAVVYSSVASFNDFTQIVFWILLLWFYIWLKLIGQETSWSAS